MPWYQSLSAWLWIADALVLGGVMVWGLVRGLAA